MCFFLFFFFLGKATQSREREATSHFSDVLSPGGLLLPLHRSNLTCKFVGGRVARMSTSWKDLPFLVVQYICFPALYTPLPRRTTTTTPPPSAIDTFNIFSLCFIEHMLSKKKKNYIFFHAFFLTPCRMHSCWLINFSFMGETFHVGD